MFKAINNTKKIYAFLLAFAIVASALVAAPLSADAKSSKKKEAKIENTAGEWQKDNGAWCFVKPDGTKALGEWVLYDGAWYYLKANGTMAEDETLSVDGISYRFTASGEMIPVSIITSGKTGIGRGVTEEELLQAYKIASAIVNKYASQSRENQLKGIYKELRRMTEKDMEYSMTAPHYNTVYGFFVLNCASCAGATRAVGLCLKILGIEFEHVNENQFSHQWCRVNIDGVYWICDAYGMYVGPEPGPYLHPTF